MKSKVCGRVVQTIRLGDDVDAPESDQPFGPRAQKRTANLLTGKKFVVERSGAETYGRLVGRIWLKDGRLLAMVLV